MHLNELECYFSNMLQLQTTRLSDATSQTMYITIMCVSVLQFKHTRAITKIVTHFNCTFKLCYFVHTTHVSSFCVSYGGQGIPLHFTSTW